MSQTLHDSIAEYCDSVPMAQPEYWKRINDFDWDGQIIADSCIADYGCSLIPKYHFTITQADQASSPLFPEHLEAIAWTMVEQEALKELMRQEVLAATRRDFEDLWYEMFPDSRPASHPKDTYMSHCHRCNRQTPHKRPVLNDFYGHPICVYASEHGFSERFPDDSGI